MPAKKARLLSFKDLEIIPALHSLAFVFYPGDKKGHVARIIAIESVKGAGYMAQIIYDGGDKRGTEGLVSLSNLYPISDEDSKRISDI